VTNHDNSIVTSVSNYFLIKMCLKRQQDFHHLILLYGRTVRGLMQILKELWANNVEVLKTKTSYQYVLELQNRLEVTMKLARLKKKIN